MKILDSIYELAEFLRSEEEISIYGAGANGRRLCMFLRQKGISVSRFLITDADVARTWRETSIDAIEGSGIEREHVVLIGTSERYHREIEEKILETGCRKYAAIGTNLWREIRYSIDYSRINVSPRNPVQVLLFHRVIEKKNDPWQLEVSPYYFEKYISYLADHYHILHFEDEWNNVSEPSIVITFDDGYFDNYKYAKPILEKYDVHATIFVTSGCIGKGTEFWWDRLSRLIPADQVPDVRDKLKGMHPDDRENELKKIERCSGPHTTPLKTDRAVSEEELKRLADSSVIAIGAHTITHTMLSALSESEQRVEIERSKTEIEKIIGEKVITFSYPFGGKGTYTKDTIQIVKEAGFKKAASNFRGLFGENGDLYEIPRNAQPECELEEFALKIQENWMLYDE